MINAKDAVRFYYLRRHLQLARSRGALTVWEYLASLDFLLDRESEILRGRDGKVPFHYDRSEFVRQSLRVLEQHGILPGQVVADVLALPIGEDAALTPIIEDELGLAPDPVVAPVLAPPPAAAAPAAPPPAAPIVEEEVSFDLLCPHCETLVPGGTTACPACSKSILTVT